MTTPTTAGWTCAQCGILVGVDQSHTCRTDYVPYGALLTSEPARYRVKGRIERNPAAPGYLVDLTVEPIR